jgi:DNA-binding response OmpR family regulator
VYEPIAEESTKLLILDRDPRSAAGISEMLREHGCGCTIVHSLAGILKSIKSQQPSAVLVRAALQQPEFGCDHIVRVLKQAYPDLPVVITATESNRRVAAIWDEFGVPCLMEPFEPEQLFAALRGTQGAPHDHRKVSGGKSGGVTCSTRDA